MGRVFTPEQIARGEIPEPGAHEIAARAILAELFIDPRDATEPLPWSAEDIAYLNVHVRDPIWRLTPETRVDGADAYQQRVGLHAGMVYGSTVLGTAGLRSDVDVLVVYHPTYAGSALQLMRRVFEEVERDYRVAVEAKLLDVSAIRGVLRHNVDPLFARHLLAVQDQDDPRWSVNWPVEGLRDMAESITQDQARLVAVAYCCAKAQKFAEAIAACRGDVDYHVLQRALELPKALGRKIIAAMFGPDRVDQATLQNGEGMVTQLCDLARKIARKMDGPVVRNIAQLADFNDAYDGVLNEAINGDMSPIEYEAWLRGHYVAALMLAHDVSLAWPNLLYCDAEPPKVDDVVPAFPEGTVLFRGPY